MGERVETEEVRAFGEAPTLVRAEPGPTPRPGSDAGLKRLQGRRRGWLVRRMLVLADLIGLSVAFALVMLVFGFEWKDFLACMATLPIWIVIARLYRLYDQDEERTHHPTTDDAIGVFHLVTIGTWVMYVGLKATGLAQPTVTKAVLLWAAAIVSITLTRTAARTLCRRSQLYQQNTLIFGAGDVGQRVARKLLRHPEYGLNLVGFVDADPKPRHPDLVDLPLLGGPDRAFPDCLATTRSNAWSSPSRTTQQTRLWQQSVP